MLPFVKKVTHRDNGTKLMFATAEAGVSDTLILLTIISLFLGASFLTRGSILREVCPVRFVYKIRELLFLSLKSIIFRVHHEEGVRQECVQQSWYTSKVMTQAGPLHKILGW